MQTRVRPFAIPALLPSMRIHRLNCVGSRPIGGRLVDGSTRGTFSRGLCVNHCLAVETGEGLMLVDTGLGTGDVLDPDRRLAPIARKLLAPDLRVEMTALRQIEQMGYRADDVRDIVLTHLDFDQVGGLDDFPRARVHVFASEVDHARAQKRWGAKQRYRPAQWSTRQHWIQYAAMSEAPWKGMDCVRDLVGLPADLVVMVPLPGHTPGHAGVAICGENGWHLHCGDAYTDARELDGDPQCRLGMQVYERATAHDRKALLDTQQQLRLLHYKHPDVILNCSRDPREFERLAGRPAHLPVEAVTAMQRDAYTAKIVRNPRAATFVPRESTTGVPGIEVVDHDEATFDFEPFVTPRDPAPQPPSH